MGSLWRAAGARPEPTQHLLRISVSERRRHVLAAGQSELQLSGEKRFEAVATQCQRAEGPDQNALLMDDRKLGIADEDCDEAREADGRVDCWGK